MDLGTPRHRHNTALLLPLVMENVTTLDWLALTQLLRQHWAQFTLLGVDLQDGKLVTRCMWLVGLVVSSQYVMQ